MDSEFIQVRLKRDTYALLESYRKRLTEGSENGRNDLETNRATKTVSNEQAVRKLLQAEQRDHERSKRHAEKVKGQRKEGAA